MPSSHGNIISKDRQIYGNTGLADRMNGKAANGRESQNSKIKIQKKVPSRWLPF
jgi:hypothetical protein